MFEVSPAPTKPAIKPAAKPREIARSANPVVKPKFEKAITHFESYIDNEAYTDTHQEYCRLAVDALKAAKTKWELEHPIPLTFDQLMQVKSGTYIWTKVVHGHGIADGTVRHKLWIPEIRSKADFESYGTDWLAYLEEPPHGTEYIGTEFWKGE